jgi:anthranilate phosphoribosyltransferase
MFAPMLHGAMKYAIGPRREIGIRTVFNVLGPLTNPAGANIYLLGVYAPELVETLAGVLARFDVKRALVVCGEGNIDEITITGETRVADLADGKITSYTISPEDVGLKRATLSDIRGGDTAEKSAEQLRSVLRGESGPCLDTVLLNGGAALLAAGKVTDLQNGVDLARKTIESGAAMAKLEALVAASNEV